MFFTIYILEYTIRSSFPVCNALPSPCKIGPVSHHTSAQLLLLYGVIESLLQGQAEDKLYLVTMDYSHPLWPGQVGSTVVKKVEVDPSLSHNKRK